MANDPVAIAVLAKAPVPGFAKTRLIPVLGAEGAAAFAARLIERAVAAACEAATGPVTLWATPDASHALFSEISWSTPDVMNETRRRLQSLGLTWREPHTLWDVDVPDDLVRLRESGMADLIAGIINRGGSARAP